MAFLLAVSLIWAFSFGLIGSRLAGLDSSFVASVRLTLAWICFAPFFSLSRLNARELLQLVGIGALQFGVMYLCYIRAFAYLPSHLVALFSIFTPLYIVLAYEASRRRWRWQLFACALLSVAGAAVIKFDTPGGSYWTGFALMQGSNLAFGIGQLCYRQWRRARPQLRDHQTMGALYAGGAIFATAVFVLIGDYQKSVPSPTQWTALGYLGVVASGLGFFWWNRGAVQATPGALAAANNAVVPLAMAASLFVFGEADSIVGRDIARLLAGAALIFGAMAWGNRAGRERPASHGQLGG